MTRLFMELPDILRDVIKEVARSHNREQIISSIILKKEVGIYLPKLKEKCPEYFDTLRDEWFNIKYKEYINSVIN